MIMIQASELQPLTADLRLQLDTSFTGLDTLRTVCVLATLVAQSSEQASPL